VNVQLAIRRQHRFWIGRIDIEQRAWSIETFENRLPVLVKQLHIPKSMADQIKRM